MPRTAPPLISAVVVALFATPCATLAAGDSPDDRPPVTEAVAPTVHKGDGWAIAAPADWTPMPGMRPPALLFLVGDGRAGVPLTDGTLSPLKAGLLVERLPKPDAGLKARVATELRGLKGAPQFKLLAEPESSDITLADGTAAVLLRAQFVRRDNGRLSVQRKVYAADPQGRVVVATGFITCSRAGRSFVEKLGLPDFVEAHTRSLVLGPDKADATKLNAAYAKVNRDIAAALARTDAGNDLLAKNGHAAAIEAFREALKLCEHISAANNGLAWALLFKDGSGPKELEEALSLAKKAVEQTESLDYSALDTLAVAQHRSGNKAQAVTTIKRALQLRPSHPELLQRLKSFGEE